MKIVCIGEVMTELSLSNDASSARLGVAGDTFNTAVYLKRSGKDIHDIAYLTALGTDRFSDQIVQRINDEQLNSDHIIRSKERVAGLYAITTDDMGERSFTYWRENSAARLLFGNHTGPDFDTLAQFDVLYYSAISLAILAEDAKDLFLQHVEAFRALPGKQVAFDSNYRPRLWSDVDQARRYTEQAWRLCDIALPSVDDEMTLFEDIDEQAVLKRLRSFGVVRGALKRGAAGPIDLENPSASPSLKPVAKVVDSTAAGDSFNGAYLACLLNGGTPVKALQAGHDCASHVVQHAGAIVEQ